MKNEEKKKRRETREEKQEKKKREDKEGKKKKRRTRSEETQETKKRGEERRGGEMGEKRWETVTTAAIAIWRYDTYRSFSSIPFSSECAADVRYEGQAIFSLRILRSEIGGVSVKSGLG